jgi:hypothetical protein
MATTATLIGGFEYKDEPKSATLIKAYIYGGDFALGAFEYIKTARPKFFTFLIE